MNWKLDAQKYLPSLLTYTVTSLILTQSNVRPAIFMLRGPDDFSEWVSRYVDLKLVR